MGVPGLPSLSEGDMYSCFFEDTETAASVQGTTVTCATPEAHRLPALPQGEGEKPHTLMTTSFQQPEKLPLRNWFTNLCVMCADSFMSGIVVIDFQAPIN